MKHRYTLITLAAAIAIQASAQEVQKCCGTSNSTFLLGNIDYARHTQCLYTPADLTGEAAGYITRLYYRYGSTGIDAGNTLGEFSVSLGQTDMAAFDGLAFFTDVDLALQTAAFTIAPGAQGDWFAIDLATPFLYDPTRTLIVDIRFTTSVTENFGTLSTTATDRKMMSASTTDLEGELWDSLQDLGFDLDDNAGISAHAIQGSTVLPNPATTYTELRLPAPLNAHAMLTLTDATGRIVRSQQVPQGSTRIGLDLAALPAGMYLLHLHDAAGPLLTQRLVKE